MKKIIILLALISSKLFSQSDLPFDFMFLTTDLNGVIEINNSIITYGNYGVIMTSDDIGKTWRQKTIGNDLNIKKIIKNVNDLYGIANNIIFKSSDGGNKWISSSVSNDTLLEISFYNDKLYCLTKNKLFLTDIDLQHTDSLKIKLNEAYNISEFQIAENNIFIPINNGRIISYNITNQVSDTINFKSLSFCDSCFKPSKLKFIDDKLYVSLDSSILESNDLGKTWNIKAKTKSVYNVSSGNVFSLGYSYTPFDLSKIANIDYLKCNSNFYNEKKNINSNTRTISTYNFSEFIYLNNNVILAVGANKLILISNNNGLDWEVKSYLSYSSRDFSKSYYSLKNFINGKLGYLFSTDNLRTIYHTRDSGITWKPQKFDLKFRKIKSFLYNYNTSYFDSTGFGFIHLNQESAFQDYNILTTYDFGETFEFRIDSLIRNTDPNNPKSIFKSKNNLLSFINSGFYNNRYTLLYFYEYNKPVKYIQYDSVQFEQVFQDENEDLYAITHHRRNPTKDVGGVFQLEYYELVKSIDGGENWTTLRNCDTIMNKEKHTELINKHFLIIKDYGELTYLTKDSLGNSIFVPGYTLDSLYLYNIETGKLDNIYGRGKDTSLSSKFYYLNGSIYAFGKKKIYENKNLFVNPQIWIEHDVMLKDYKVTNYYSDINGIAYFDAIYLKYDQMQDLLKLIPKLSTSSSVSSQTEETTYFYSYPPFPIPAMNELKSLIYWDMSYNIDDSDIGVYDIYGNKIANRDKISINKLNAYSGYLSWDCSGVGTGVYLIQLKHGTNTHNIRAMVVR